MLAKDMIREYKVGDMRIIMDVWYRASLVAHNFLSKEFMEKDRKDIIRTCIPDAEIWVYEENDGIVGFIAMFGNHIGGLFVRPDKQKKGIGTALVKHVKSYRRGALTVEVFKENDTGTSFYRKAGFFIVKEFIHQETGHTAVLMEFPS